MSRLVTLRPNGTTSSSGTHLGGGATTISGALSDQAQSTYIDVDDTGGNMVETFDDISLAAGEQIVSLYGQFLGRPTLSPNGAELISINLNDQTNPSTIVYANTAQFYNSVAFWSVFAKIFGPASGGLPGGGWSVALINAMKMGITTAPPFSASGRPMSTYRFNEVELLVEVLARPSVTGVGPSGTVSDPSPTITWTWNGDTGIKAGDPSWAQLFYRTKVFTSAVAGAGGFDAETSVSVWDSGEVASAATSKQVGIALADGAYVLYVKAAQGQKHWSPWVGSAITIGHGPNIPLLIAPNSGQVLDANAGFTSTWTYSHSSGTAEASWAYRRKSDGGAYSYWNNSTSTWGASIVWNAGAVTSKVFGSGAWPNGHTYGWAVAVTDTLGITSAFGTDAVLLASGPPTVSAVGPSGTVTTSTHPTITWTYTDGISRPEATFEVKVFLTSDTTVGGFDATTATTAVWTSGIQAGPATSIVPDYDFPPNGTSYKVYVRASAGGQTSAWATATFNVSLTAPAAPTLTVTENTGYNGVDVVISGGGGGSFTSIQTRVERLIPGGVWQVVRFGGALAGSSVTDYEVPARTTVSYRARMSGITGGTRLAGVYSSVVTVSLSPTSWWVKDIVSPLTRWPAPVADGFKLTTPVQAGTFDTVGGAGAAVVIAEAQARAQRGTLAIWVKSALAEASLLAMLVPGRTLLVQDVLDQQWYVQVYADWDQTFVRSPSATLPREHVYQLDVPVVVVARPPTS